MPLCSMLQPSRLRLRRQPFIYLGLSVRTPWREENTPGHRTLQLASSVALHGSWSLGRLLKRTYARLRRSLVGSVRLPPGLLPGEHDDAVAAVSHLPQVIAALMVEHAANHGDRLRLAAGSFRDLTRVALSDPGLWVDILTHNSESVVSQLEELAGALTRTARLVERGDDEAIRDLLGDAQAKRRLMAPPVVAVRVLLADEPGELGRVGAALAESAVDVRDLQLRHARHGGGGVLTLSVRPGESELLRSSLSEQGFEFS